MASNAPLSEDQLALLLKAIDFSADKHQTQRRKDAAATPYINHPLALMNTLFFEGGVRDHNVLIAALLHDTVEDTETTEEELARHFGAKIASIVMEVTDDKSLPKAERKHLQIKHVPHMSIEAKLVKLADKIANMRDIKASPPADWDEARKAEYFVWCWKVVGQIQGLNTGLESIVSDLCDGYKNRPYPGGHPADSGLKVA